MKTSTSLLCRMNAGMSSLSYKLWLCPYSTTPFRLTNWAPLPCFACIPNQAWWIQVKGYTSCLTHSIAGVSQSRGDDCIDPSQVSIKQVNHGHIPAVGPCLSLERNLKAVLSGHTSGRPRASSAILRLASSVPIFQQPDGSLNFTWCSILFSVRNPSWCTYTAG